MATKVKTPKMSLDEVRALMAQNLSVAVTTRKLREAGFNKTVIENLLFVYARNQYQPVEIARAGYDISMYTFGVEIECVDLDPYQLETLCERSGIAMQREQYNHRTSETYKIVTDGSLRGANAYEVVSPVLKGAKGENEIKTVCDNIQQIGANVNATCGLHVHIGAAGLTMKTIKNVYINYYRLENVIDSFMPRSRRGSNNNFCRTLQNIFDYEAKIERCDDCDEIAWVFRGDRYYKINACSYARHKTIEFRQHSGTIDSEKILMWATFVRKLVEYSKTKRVENVQTVDDIEFLTETEKEYFKNRKAKLCA